MSDLEVRLSGSVELLRGDIPVALPGRRVRALLILLAVSAGKPVSVDTLVRGIWDDEPPENARASLQTYVGRLRRILGNEAIATGPSGYALILPRQAVDLLHFEDLVEAAPDGAEDERAVLRSALRTWRGEPFGDVPSEWIERQLVSSWVERYLQAFERRVDLDLEAGEHAVCVPELRNLVELYPLRETLWLRLLTALQQGGRTAEALERYEVLRTRLAGELGVDPAPELQEVHRQLLGADAPTARAPEPATTTPHQLPVGIGGFTGRTSQLQALDSAVDAGERIVAVHGPGGVGKTTLTVHWAHGRREQFPDGQLFVNLRGFGPGEPLSVLDALDSLLRGLGVQGGRIPGDEDGRAALLRSELADKRMLVLLDNARAASQVRPLLPGGDSVVIVTSRSQLRGLVAREAARRVPVDPMPRDDAVALLRRRVGNDDRSSDPDTLAELAELCGRLPVALAVAAERAGRDRYVSVDTVIERLRDEQRRIAALTDWDDDPLTGVRAVFAWSYDVLDSDAARMFRLLGLFPDSQVALDAAAALAGIDAATAERLLDRLTERHLLREVRAGWYELHDLTRAYAGEVAERASDDAEHDAAVQRLRGWYLHSLRNADHAIQVALVEPAVPDPPPAVTPAEFGANDAAAWLAHHYRSIRSVFASAVADQDHAAVVAIGSSLSTYMSHIVALREAMGVAEVAYRSAECTDDSLAQAACAYSLGIAHHESGDNETALIHVRRARDLFERIDDAAGRLTAQSTIGVVLGNLGRLEEAAECHRRARADAQDSPLWELRARIENNLADCCLQLGRHEEALETARAAIESARNIPSGVSDDISVYLITLAEAQQAHGDWAGSVETLDEALISCRRGALVRNEIVALKFLGVAYEELGRTARARRSWGRAVELLQGIDTMVAYGVSVTDLQTMIGDLPAD